MMGWVRLARRSGKMRALASLRRPVRKSKFVSSMQFDSAMLFHIALVLFVWQQKKYMLNTCH